MDKNHRRVGLRVGSGDGWGGGSGGGKWRQLYLNNSKNKNKKIHEWTNKEIKIKLHMPWKEEMT